MHKLHPGAKWQFRFNAYISLIAPIVVLTIFSLNPIIRSMSLSFSIALGGILIILLFLITFGEIYARMAYNRWKFEFTETNLKKEHGIIWKKYSNIPYERIQNVDIHRGVLARIFGFSSVLVHTAGYSNPAQGRGLGAEGYIPAVSPSYAEKIRDFLMHKISRKGSNSGGL